MAAKANLRHPRRGGDMVSGHAMKAVDFFCGGGGMSLGAKWADVRVVAAIDNDPICKDTYEANHEGRFLPYDIKDPALPDALAKSGVRRNDDNMIFVGCSPCQYWSGINGKPGSKRKAAAKPTRNLLRDFLRLVKHFRPGWIVVENVTGILRHADESGLAELKEFLDGNNYKHNQKKLSVRDYGVPQTRTRYVLIASRTIGDCKIPFPHKKAGRPQTVRKCIGKQPRIKAGDKHADDKLHRASALSETNLARLAATKEGGDRSGWAKKQRLQIRAYRGKDVSFFRENYGRMRWNAQAPTITTRFFSLSCGRFGHPDQDRAISLREGAMLQTFPKEYQFKTRTIQNTARLIGNAVPPEFAMRLFRAIAECQK